MVELTRTVRFCVNDGAPGAPDVGWGAPNNTFAAYPSMRGLGRHYELDVMCRGEADAATGYFVNIKEIDKAARGTLIPEIERACRGAPGSDPARVLRDGLASLAGAIGEGRLLGVRWRLSPYYSVEVQMGTPGIALMRQQFEFAAAHRLHVQGIPDDRNRELFGKCNNPSGHGHNYRVEPAVEVPIGGRHGPAFTLQDLERVTHESLISYFDHTHLNLDTSEFRVDGGVNPSVENIARVCYERLGAALRGSNPDVRLRSVTVWETDKTSCTYPG